MAPRGSEGALATVSTCERGGRLARRGRGKIGTELGCGTKAAAWVQARRHDNLKIRRSGERRPVIWGYNPLGAREGRTKRSRRVATATSARPSEGKGESARKLCLSAWVGRECYSEAGQERGDLGCAQELETQWSVSPQEGSSGSLLIAGMPHRLSCRFIENKPEPAATLLVVAAKVVVLRSVPSLSSIQAEFCRIESGRSCFCATSLE